MKYFQIDSQIDYYKPDSHSGFSPYIFFHKTFGVSCSRYSTNKKYSLNLLDFLLENALVINYSKNIKIKTNCEKLESYAPTIRGFIIGDDSFDDTNLSYFFYYKNNVINLSVKDGFCFVTFYFDAKNGEIVEEFNEFEDLEQYKQKARVSLVLKQYGEINIHSLDITDFKDFDLVDSYGKDFLKIHDRVVDKLTNYNNGGLYHFSGPPGVGKSFYLKYLTSVINREFIFIPVSLTDVLNSPDFLSILLEHKNSVLVIEDAEKVIRSREDDNHSLVSTILNMADGILSSLLKVSIIVTHNTDRDNIDKALLRKGRLVVDYQFGKLSTEDSQNLLNKLKLDYKAKEPMSLADIYNLKEETNFKEKEIVKIGF